MIVWTDDEGCTFPYEELPHASGHFIGARHKGGRLIDPETGEVVARYSPHVYRKWREGTLVEGYAPVEHVSARDTVEADKKAREEGQAAEEISVEVGKRRGRSPQRPGTEGPIKIQVRPVVHDIDPILYVFYDFTRMRLIAAGYEYDKSFPDWLREVVVRFYSEHTDEFGLLHLFTDEEQRILQRGLMEATGSNGRVTYAQKAF